MDEFKYQTARDIELPPGKRRSTVRREQGHFDALIHTITGSLAKTYLRLYHRLIITGKENLPEKPPFVLIANHGSHLDTAVIASILPARQRSFAYPLAAGDTFFESLVSKTLATTLINVLPVRRSRADRHAFQDLRDRLIGEGCIYIIYPEGTRAAGQDLTPFKSGIGLLVAELDVAVIPCYIHGAAAALPRGKRIPRPVTIRVHLGQPMNFQDTPSNREGWRTIAESLHTQVQQLASQTTNP